MKDSNVLSRRACADDVTQCNRRNYARYAHVGVGGSGQRCSHRAVSRNHVQFLIFPLWSQFQFGPNFNLLSNFLWSRNKFARSIVKFWPKPVTNAWIHTCDYKQCCYVSNIAKQCRLGLFQDSDLAGDLEDSKATSGGILCALGSPTFVPTSLICKKQTSVSHSFTESEIISLDAWLRLDGMPAFDVWDLIVSIFGNTIQTHDRTGQPVVNKREACSSHPKIQIKYIDTESQFADMWTKGNFTRNEWNH